MMRRRTLAAVFVVSTLTALPAFPQQPPAINSSEAARSEVLVLGVYHMANPGRDIVTGEIDDVLAPERQAEIAEVIEVLKRFRPTKIVVEARFNDGVIATRYEEYVAGIHELSRNETEQIGYRLAKQLGHEAVYPADVSGEFPFPRLQDYAKAHERMQEFDALRAEIGETGKAFYTYLASHTVLETMLYMNSDEYVAKDVGFYYRQAHFGEPWNWAGADLLAAWFQRNIRIYSNIVGIIDSPDDRVLVIFGAGHLGWLRQNVANDPLLRLRRLDEFVM